MQDLINNDLSLQLSPAPWPPTHFLFFIPF
uniref:Uncharacterized protein n=1 Tax=Anguilla anguilla TaxID=7936 RepID=A0A0E9SII7_ANGAN